jgi:hypothetical protein
MRILLKLGVLLPVTAAFSLHKASSYCFKTEATPPKPQQASAGLRFFN